MDALAGALLAVTLGGPVRDLNGDGRVTIACLGDSNTAQLIGVPRIGWCERLAAGRGRSWRVVNRAMGVTTITDVACRILPALRCGPEQVTETLDEDAPDAAILAFGTNDVAFGSSVEEIVAAYRAQRRRLEAAGVQAYVALAPAHHADPAVTDGLRRLDRALRRTFPPRRLIDFAARLTEADFDPDAIHLNDRGQAKRARRARRALLARRR